MDRRRVFQVVVVAGALMAYLTIIVGGDVRSSGAGMDCGDSWPLCTGGVIPNLSDPGIAIEFAHRVVAFTTSLLVLVALILAFLWYRRRPLVLFLALTCMLLLIAQVILGMVTVQSDLSPAVVTAHLALGTATFAMTLVLAVVSLMRPPASPSPSGAPS